MKLGFIGTGQITKAVVLGILNSKLKIKNIFLSERNKVISNYLKKKSSKIKIKKNNQEIIDKSDWIFLAVTPIVGKKILKSLKYKHNQVIISFISTISMQELKKIIKIKNTIVRAIPLPPISLKKGPVPIYPPDKRVSNFFDKLGTSVQINKENLSLNFWSTSSMMAPFYGILKTMTDWLVNKGIKRNIAQKYITSLFEALSKDAFINSNKDLKVLLKESQTPKGLNEQAIKELNKLKFYKSIDKTLTKILKRLKKA